jgi:putative spermidine/putrescine transport system substrate-binding protein
MRLRLRTIPGAVKNVLGLMGVIVVASAASSSTTGTGKVVIAEFGGAYSQSVRDVFAEPFSRQTGYDAQVVDMGDFGAVVAKIKAMVKAHNTQWDMIELLGTQANELVAREGWRDCRSTSGGGCNAFSAQEQSNRGESRSRLSRS